MFGLIASAFGAAAKALRVHGEAQAELAASVAWRCSLKFVIPAPLVPCRALAAPG
jgi:hypothetical protein